MSQDIISEIQEYEIMYTYNISQKLKKWNDGKLKYFKFNNKVQVFNDDSILITQQFLQNNKLLQESNCDNESKVGGVLVTIGSMISESTRNLTKMFKKETVTPKTSIVYPKPQVSNTTTRKIIDRAPLKDLSPVPGNMNRSSLLGLKRRRVGLSKSMTPSKKTQSKPTTSNDELDLLAPIAPIYKDEERKSSLSDTKHQRRVPNDTPSKSTTVPNDEGQALSSPPLISSDKYLLLRPICTPSKDQVQWDDESMRKSNTKIQTLQSLITPRRTPRSVKRIVGNRSKREIINVSKPNKVFQDSTPSRSRIEVYASDSDDEIKSQSQSQDEVRDERVEKVTQTVTYDYGGKGFKISDISKL